MEFEELYKLVELSGNEISFNREECLALYDLAKKLNKKSIVVEIGIQFGRSTTVLGVCAKERGFELWAIDNWKEDVSKEAEAHVRQVLLNELKLPVQILPMDSKVAYGSIPRSIDLLFIDGDHTYNGVKADILNYTPKLKSGGYVCFDDYGHDSLPDVYKAIVDFLPINKFDFVGRYGDKLGVFQKL